MEYNIFSFPEQQISNASKTKAWRKRHLDYIDNMNSMNESAIRQDIYIKRINQDLTLGKLHMEDLQLVLNPDGVEAGYIPDNIQHYPIINAKLNLLIGEEIKRPFDYSVIVTNPTSITQMERDKKAAIFQSLQQWVQQEFPDEQTQQQELERINKYYTYEYQDFREKRANEYLNHFVVEQDFPSIFNEGFRDGITLAEESYMCDIISGEPVLYKLNPFELQIYMSGYSNRIEDAEVVTITQYLPLGKIFDRYFSDGDFSRFAKKLEKNLKEFTGGSTEMDENDYRPAYSIFDPVPNGFDPFAQYGDQMDVTQPYDQFGNIRVIRMFWKSRRKIKEIKKYDQQTGQEYYELYSDSYIPDSDNGEEETVFWINEAWEGTKIGKDIYVQMGPRPIQYSSMTNPSKCHFGIIGQIYAFNGHKPFSLVDMMKPYNYLYDVIADRLNKAIAADWGGMMTLDLAKKPKNWSVDQWLYFAKINHLNVIDSFNEGEYGRSTGVIAGGLNNNTQSLVTSNTGAYISQLIQTLAFVEQSMSDVVGISKQREGQISNRETVGGVERSTLQSSHITEWVFTLHNQCKRRVLECFLETAKYAARQRQDKTIKFSYIASDTSQKVVEIDADEFCECDYGIVLRSDATRDGEQIQKLDMLVQAALQNQMINFSTAMKIFQTCSFSEKIRMIEQSELEAQQRMEQQKQQEQQMQQQQIQAQMQAEQIKMQHESELNDRDNETKIIVANIQAQSKLDSAALNDNEQDQQHLDEQIREFNEKIQLENRKFEHQKDVDAQSLQIDKQKLQQQKNKQQKQ